MYTAVYSFGDTALPKLGINGTGHGLIHATIGAE